MLGHMPTITRTHTRTHLGIFPANPFLTCATCGGRVKAFHDERCGCHLGGAPVNMPCMHQGDYNDLCPSWGPVDGCTCMAVLGHVAHPEVLAS